MKTLLIATVLSLTAATAGATEAADSATVYFRQSSIKLDLNMHGNRAHIDSIVSAASRHHAGKISTIHISGGASPEGSVALNDYLSQNRALAIIQAIGERMEMPDSLITVYSAGRDWVGLRAAVSRDADVPFRTDVLTLLDTIIAHPQPLHADRLRELKQLHRGVPYAYLYRNIFPDLRRSAIAVHYVTDRRWQPVPVDTVRTLNILPDMPEPRLQSTVVPDEPVKTCRPLYLALKSNLLYDAAALPSIGAEAYVGKGWSVVANWTYGWWDNDREHRYWRAYGGDLAVRRWFGRRAAEKPLTGHHLGVYAGVVTYDFEFGGKGHMGGLPGRNLWDRCNVMAGIEYGYSLPVSRRLNIDFTIGLGYLGGKVITYKPSGNFYVWQKTSHLNWVGPTKVEVSLVWLIGCDNYNRKGGRK